MAARLPKYPEPTPEPAPAASVAALAIKAFGWRRWLFYLGVPGALALYGAVNNELAIETSGLWQTIWFYCAHSFVPWWITITSTFIVLRVLARWQPPAPAVWAIGAFMACVIVVPYTRWVGMQPSGMAAGAESGADITMMTFLFYAGRLMVVWLLVNFFFERVIGLPRFRYARPDEAVTDPVEDSRAMPVAVADSGRPSQKTAPEFLSKSKKLESIADLYSVSAQEHYIRLHTARGDELVYKRFSDAVKELEGVQGFRVHRSHWVSPYGVAGIICDGKKMFVKLKDGPQLPVSRPYQQLVRNHARDCGVHIASR